MKEVDESKIQCMVQTKVILPPHLKGKKKLNHKEINTKMSSYLWQEMCLSQSKNV